MDNTMIKTTQRFVMLAAALALVGCGKDASSGGAGGSSCPALEVTIDGKAVEGLTHGLALTHKKGSELTQEVNVFNHTGVTCEEILSKSGRTITKDDEMAVKAHSGGSFGNGAAIGSHSVLRLDVALEGKAPSKQGDPVTLCLHKATFKPRIGPYKDKEVVMAGSFKGTYCGVMEW